MTQLHRFTAAMLDGLFGGYSLRLISIPAVAMSSGPCQRGANRVEQFFVFQFAGAQDLR